MSPVFSTGFQTNSKQVYTYPGDLRHERVNITFIIVVVRRSIFGPKKTMGRVP